MQADTVIHNVTVVTHDRTFMGGVAIRDGKITALAERPDELPVAKEAIDGRGRHLIPGLVDAHMHLHYPANGLAENMRSETASSPARGVTTPLHLPLAAAGPSRRAHAFRACTR